jgi:hypothetical protein
MISGFAQPARPKGFASAAVEVVSNGARETRLAAACPCLGGPSPHPARQVSYASIPCQIVHYVRDLDASEDLDVATIWIIATRLGRPD